MMRYALGIVIMISVIGTALSPAQEDGTQLLQKGIESLDELYIEDAIQQLEEAIKVGLESEDDRIRCYSYLARAYITMGDEGKAINSYLELLRLKPDFEIGEESPKVIAVFEKARNQADLEPPVIRHDPPKPVKVGDRAEIVVEATDNRGVKAVSISYKMPNGESRIEGMSRSGDRFIYEMPALGIPGQIDYSIVAVDAWGNESNLTTGTVQVIVKKSGALRKILMIAGSAIIAGAGGTVYYLLSSGGAGEDTGDNGGDGGGETSSWPGSFPMPPD